MSFGVGFVDVTLFEIMTIDTTPSPTLDRLSIVFEQRLGQSFGEVVRSHFGRWTLDDIEFFVIIMIPEPVPFCQEILRPAGDTMVLGQIISTLIVLENSAVQRNIFQFIAIGLVDDFQDQSLEW